MEKQKVVSKEEWLAARKALLNQEKAFTKLRDELSQKRRDLPWLRIDKNYQFQSNTGEKKLAELFDGRSQLIVYHFMFGPDWEEGCKSCSFWADNFNNIIVHLNQRDVTMLAISRTSLEKLNAYKKRLGWSFEWLSSEGSDFNYNFQVSFKPDETKEAIYNYRLGKVQREELPGISVFYKDSDGQVYHTYSCYARGLDMLNTAYHYLDLVPKGRDEDQLSYSQAWVRRHDEYDQS